MNRAYNTTTARSGASKFFEAMGVGFVGTVVVAAMALLEAALLMLALGTAHSIWPVAPAIGFWTTWLLLVGLRIVLGTFKQPGKSKTD